MNQQDPRLHENEEVRNDFLDVGFGFAAAFAVFFLIAAAATAVSALAK